MQLAALKKEEESLLTQVTAGQYFVRLQIWLLMKVQIYGSIERLFEKNFAVAWGLHFTLCDLALA